MWTLEMLAGLSSPEPTVTTPCKRCGRPVALPPSDHFVTLCGAACVAPSAPGLLTNLPKPYRER